MSHVLHVLDMYIAKYIDGLVYTYDLDVTIYGKVVLVYARRLIVSA